MKGKFLPFLVLLGVVLALAALFYQVVRPILLPLSLAAVVALLAHPLHRRLSAALGGRAWLSAGLVTLLLLVSVVGPLAATTYLGYAEFHAALAGLRPDGVKADELFDARANPHLAKALDEAAAATGADPARLREWASSVGEEVEDALYRRTALLLGDVPALALGAALFVLAVYFFLEDGEALGQAWDQLTPLDAAHDAAIRGEFSRVCRGVVVGTLAAAAVQAVAFGAGMWAIDRAFGVGAGGWVAVLALLTLVCASVPFLGAGAVWVPTAVVLFARGQGAAAACLAVYGALFVSQVDTVVRVWVLQDSTKLHPLLAFVCVFGGIQALGLLGLLVGPAVGAALLAGLRILKAEVARVEAGESARPPERGVMR